MKKQIITNQAPAAIGPYSQAVRCGNLLFTSGAIPFDADGNCSSDIAQMCIRDRCRCRSCVK